MKRVITGSFLVAMLAIPTFVHAATAAGTLTVTGTVADSITLTVENAGGTFSKTGNNGTSALGTTFSKYGSTPTGFTKSLGASDWTISSSFDVRVVKANSASPDYTLLANLSTDPLTIVWKINATPLVAVAASNLTSTGAYSETPVNYTWDIVIPDNLVTPTLDNTINFLATAN